MEHVTRHVTRRLSNGGTPTTAHGATACGARRLRHRKFQESPRDGRAVAAAPGQPRADPCRGAGNSQAIAELESAVGARSPSCIVQRRLAAQETARDWRKWGLKTLTKTVSRRKAE